MNALPTLREIANTDVREMDDEFKSEFSKAVKHAKERIELIEALVRQSEEFADMEYDFLYDQERHLLTLGYNVEDQATRFKLL